MSLIKCPECGKEISENEEFCYYCGYSFSERKTQGDKFNKNVISNDIIVNTPYKSIISTLLKFISVIILILGIVVSIIFFSNGEKIYGLIFMILYISFFALTYAVAEIINLLQDIRDKNN